MMAHGRPVLAGLFLSWLSIVEIVVKYTVSTPNLRFGSKFSKKICRYHCHEYRANSKQCVFELARADKIGFIETLCSVSIFYSHDTGVCPAIEYRETKEFHL